MRVPFANTNTLKVPADLVDQRVSVPADADLATCFVGAVPAIRALCCLPANFTAGCHQHSVAAACWRLHLRSGGYSDSCHPSTVPGASWGLA